MTEAVNSVVRQFQIVAEDLAEIQQQIQNIIDWGLRISSISYMNYEEKHCLFVLAKPVRKPRYTQVESVEEKQWFPSPMPLMKEQLPAVQKGSVVLYRAVFRVPVHLGSYLEIQFSGWRRDPEDLV